MHISHGFATSPIKTRLWCEFFVRQTGRFAFWFIPQALIWSFQEAIPLREWTKGRAIARFYFQVLLAIKHAQDGDILVLGWLKKKGWFHSKNLCHKCKCNWTMRKHVDRYYLEWRIVSKKSVAWRSFIPVTDWASAWITSKSIYNRIWNGIRSLHIIFSHLFPTARHVVVEKGGEARWEIGKEKVYWGGGSEGHVACREKRGKEKGGNKISSIWNGMEDKAY